MTPRTWCIMIGLGLATAGIWLEMGLAQALIALGTAFLILGIIALVVGAEP